MTKSHPLKVRQSSNMWKQKHISTAFIKKLWTDWTHALLVTIQCRA